MLWDIEERIEDAVVAYLKQTVAGDMSIYPSATDDAIQFPCAVVQVARSVAVAENAKWHDARLYNVEIAVATEAAPEKDGTGAVLRTSRQRNAAARSDAMNVLCVSALNQKLIDIGIPLLALNY